MSDLSAAICVEFFVDGKAAPQGSKVAMNRHNARGIYVKDASKGLAPWRAKVAEGARNQMGDWGLMEGPVSTRIVFYRKRPKWHYMGNNPDRELRETAPDRPTAAPDLFKLIRAVEDAMTGVVYKDDSQIVETRAEKRYADGQSEGVSILVDGACP